MTSDFSTDFDPRRVGWWQRHSVIRRLKRTSWMTGADRDLRVGRARAAQTRGELNALTRDLAVGGAAMVQQPAWTPPPSPPPPGTYAPQQPTQRYAPTSPRPARKLGARRPLLIGGLVLLFACGGGLVSCVSTVVKSISEISTQTLATADPMSEDGWTRMVTDLDDEIDVSTVVDVIVRRRSATVATSDPDDSTAVSRYYYDGDVTATTGAERVPGSSEFDLALVKGPMVVRAVARARQRSDVAASAEAYVNILAIFKNEPMLTVSFPNQPGSYSLVVGLDGSIVSESR